MAHISAVLTAAGESTRMGRPKPMLPWHDLPLLQYQIRSLTRAGVSEIVVVLGHKADAVGSLATGCGVRCVTNPHYRLGKTGSIKVGLENVDENASTVLILAVDQPRTSEIIGMVVQAHVENNALITSPQFQGHGGHPLAFSFSLKPELLQISEANKGIREVILAHRDAVTEIEIADPLVRLDLNTIEDYDDAKRRFEA